MKAKWEIQNMIFISPNLKIRKQDFYDSQWVKSEKDFAAWKELEKTKKVSPHSIS